MFTVYSKDNCNYCKKAIALLESKDENFVVEKLDTPEKIQALVQQGFKQVPQIYHNGILIPGGHDGLVKWYADREVEDSAFE